MSGQKKAPYQPPAIGTVEELSAQLLVANQNLEEANARLRRSEELRRDMLANISHDLRSPAAALRSAVDYLLADDDLAETEAAGMVEIMDRRLSAMEHLIAELHFLTSLDLPDFELHPEPVDMAALLQEYMVTQQADAKWGDRVLLMETSEAGELVWTLDALRMVRVLDNLFANALRFTAPGDTIALSWRRVAHGQQEELEITVRDTGKGIPADMLEEIFERTKTLSKARTPGQDASSGLGLSIVRGIVEKHGGRVWCESEMGKGSAFFIRLPGPPAAG